MPQFPSTASASGIWALKKQKRAAQGLDWPPLFGPMDEYFEYVSMLLHGNGTNGAQNNTFLDSSTNNFTITRNGNTTQGTFTPYGSNWSNYFDGSGDYLTTPSNTAFAFGTGDFTVEAFVFITATNSQNLRVFTTAGVGSDFAFEINSSLQLAHFNGSTSFTLGGAVPLNQWAHIAWVRSGSTVTGYINGTSIGTATSSANMSNSQTISIGATANYTSGQTAYISNLRVVKGTAVYTSSFTPSTAPLTAITNTSLLTCQSNRFIDNSSNAFSITASGDVSVQRFSPFNPTAPYAAGTDGASGYFDGSGDYLSITGASAFAIGTSAFSLEGWCYFNDVNTNGAGFGTAAVVADASTDRGVSLFLTGSGAWRFRIGRSVAGQFEDFLGTTTLVAGQWYNFKIVRTSTGTNDTRVYLNGVQEAIGTSTISLNMQKFSIGYYAPSDTSTASINGYVSGVRFTNTAVSSAIPTAPITAVSGTQLLCNFTNAGILDNAEMNNLETVGNAQISTAQSKFGGASMYFDGTGDYLTFPANNTLQFGTGNFTIEFWTYLNSVTGFQMFIDNRNSTSSTAAYITIYSSGTSLIFYTTGNDRITATSALSTGAWLHIAVSKSSGSTKMFVNGSQVGSTYSDANSYLAASTPQYIASRVSAADFNLNGYIDDLRITKGYARYTANFTPPSAPFPTN